MKLVGIAALLFFSATSLSFADFSSRVMEGDLIAEMMKDGFSKDAIQRVRQIAFMYTANVICGESHTSSASVVSMISRGAEELKIPRSILNDKSVRFAVIQMSELTGDTNQALEFCRVNSSMRDAKK